MSTPSGTPSDRDPSLARAWREASGEEPPQRLDDEIRAAARRAVKAGPTPGRRPFAQRWRVPLAIAALIAVSASLTLMISERDAHLPSAARAPVAGETAERRVAREAPVAADAGKPAGPPVGTLAPSPRSEEPTRAQSRAPTGGPTAAPAAARNGAKVEALEYKDAGAPAAARESDSAESARPAFPPAAQPLAAPNPDVLPPAALDTKGAQARREEAGPAGAPEVHGMESESAAEPRKKRDAAPELESIIREGQTSDEADQPPGRARLKLHARPSAPAASGEPEPAPEQWIERIRELRHQGLEAEAEASLRQFRERYPDFALPADLTPPREP